MLSPDQQQEEDELRHVDQQDWAGLHPPISRTDQQDWAGLHPPLLQAILLLLLPQPLLLHAYLRPASVQAAQARQQQHVVCAVAGVCRAWRAATRDALLQRCTWSVPVQRSPAAAGSLQERLEALAVASLDARRLTWAEGGGGGAVEALLCSPAFRRRSGGLLCSALGVPERLSAQLAAGFPALEAVGLSEDYGSTEAHRSHSAPMQCAPLAALPRLRLLQLELGIVDLAAVPPQVRALQLAEVDRILLPPGARGASVADRLLAAVRAQDLETLSVEAASGCVVFEEVNQAPLELELSHLARLLSDAVQLSMRWDDVMQQQRPRLVLSCAGGSLLLDAGD